jgi:Orsellinic acid/F9775 biosynthesis cluster protein D
MAEDQPIDINVIPSALAQLVAVNVEYKVLICLGSGCSRAVRPSGFLEHVRKQKHPITKDGRKQGQEYTSAFPYDYTSSTITLPTNGLMPQPIIPTVDGFQCRHCLDYYSTSRKKMKVHGNKKHLLKDIANDELFQPVRIQSWFGEGKERYWVVDESQQAVQERQAHQVAIEDVGEESSSEANTGNSSDSDSSGRDSQDDSLSDSLDDIIKEIEGWKVDAYERLMEALKKVPAAEIDAWLHFTGWNEVLGQSKHNLVKTHQFAQPPDHDEPELERVLRAWKRILERCLDTLAAIDQKDALKWWGSPKNEVAGQRPYELPQNSHTVEKYSAIWERFICYMMRTAPEEHWEDESGMLALPKSVALDAVSANGSRDGSQVQPGPVGGYPTPSRPFRGAGKPRERFHRSQRPRP